MLRAFGSLLSQAPAVLSEMLLAADFQLDTPKEVVIATPRSREDAEPLLAKLRSAFLPNRVLVVAAEGADLTVQSRLVPLFQGKVTRNGQATAYVCERRVCKVPTADPEVFARQIQKVEPLIAGSGSPQVGRRRGRRRGTVAVGAIEQARHSPARPVGGDSGWGVAPGPAGTCE